VQRSRELHPLSREHHVALEHALRLRGATLDDVAPLTARFLAYFVGEGERHFAQEEQLLLPVIPGGHAAARERLIADHVEIRDQARALGERLGPADAVRLGELLASHIRFEERELFPMLEQRLSPAALADIGRRLPTADA
jgi:hemerythrin-like domain-containing protein